eukprot:4766936-Alexandrium_andersonii.AAC.1
MCIRDSAHARAHARTRAYAHTRTRTPAHPHTRTHEPKRSAKGTAATCEASVALAETHRKSSL